MSGIKFSGLFTLNSYIRQVIIVFKFIVHLLEKQPLFVKRQLFVWIFFKGDFFRVIFPERYNIL